MKKVSLNGQWSLFDKSGAEYTVQVPGDINYDMYVNKNLPPMYVDENYKLYRFAEEDFIYKKVFALSEEDISYKHIYLAFQGVDTFAEIYVNDIFIGKTDNAFLGYTFDVKGIAKTGENILMVKMLSTMRIYNATNAEKYSALFDKKRILLRRPQCHYGWDWAPELVGYGIYQDVNILLQGEKRIDSVYHLTENDGSLRVFADLKNDLGYRSFAENDYLRYEVEFEGETLISVTKSVEEIKNFVNLKIPDVKLWWPNGYGEQNLYRLKISLLSGDATVDEQSFNIGFRTIKVLEKAWNEDETTFAFEVNGVKIFGKGSNWVPLDACTGTISDEKYEKAILLAKEANMNMLRVWGGGLYEKDVFYDICDKCGIMVWQDCMISCAEIPDDIEMHRKAVMEEWQYNVLRLRNHPSLLCWTGGNERIKWTGDKKCQGDELVNIYLRGVVAHLDPSTPYFNQSPHGYSSKDNDLKSGDCHKSAFDIITPENISDYRKILSGFHTNFNSECTSLGPTVEKSYKKMFGEQNQWPRTETWIYRHSRNPYAKVDLPFIDKIFLFGERVYGTMTDLADFCKKGMAVHAKFLGTEFDYHRSSDRNSGVMNWMYSDIWPTGNWSLVDYYLERKAAYYAAKRSFEPIAPIFSYMEDGKTHLVVSNQTTQPICGNISYGGKRYNGEVLWKKEQKDVVVKPAENCTMDALAEDTEGDYFYADLSINGKTISRIYQKDMWAISPIEGQCSYEIRQEAFKDGGYITSIYFAAKTFTQMIAIEYWGDEFIRCSDNYFDMQARENKTVNIYSKLPLEIEKIKISFLNEKQSEVK